MHTQLNRVGLCVVMLFTATALASCAALPFDSSEEALEAPGDGDDPGSGVLLPEKSFQLIVTSYPWIDESYADAHPISTMSRRMPEWAHHKQDLYKPQSTPEYGQRTADLLNSYGAKFLTGFWHGEGAPIFDNFRGSFEGVNLGRLRLIYMGGVIFNFETAQGREELRQELLSWRSDTQNRSRYGYATANRPIIMLWGPVPAGQEANFRWMVANVREYYAQVGLNPFFIMTQHAVNSNEDVKRSIDAVYNHVIDKPEIGQAWSTAASIPGTEQRLDRNARLLEGMRNLSTNLPVQAIPGAMPQFDRELFSMNYVPGAGLPIHGRVIAGSKEQVVDMFQMVKNNAVTIYGKEWAVISTWNEWAEGSTLEPTTAAGAKYPGGNYQYDFLEALEEVFSSQ